MIFLIFFIAKKNGNFRNSINNFFIFSYISSNFFKLFHPLYEGVIRCVPWRVLIVVVNLRELCSSQLASEIVQKMLIHS